MQVDLDYGAGKLTVRLPPGCEPTIIRKREVAPLSAPAQAVRRALREPVGGVDLATAARGRRSACILICDITRPVPNALLLRPIIETLLGAGVPRAGISVLVATGLHRPNEGAELAELVGDAWVLEQVSVANHFALDDAAHVDLGRTPGRGVPVKLDRRFVAAELRIVTGLVEPHFMAGYSGGRKVIAPGIAHADTIRTFHNARFMGDPAARQCNLLGNPLHEEQLAILGMVGEVLAVNTVLDEQRRLTFVNFGDIEASHAVAVAEVQAASVVPVPRRFHTVLTSAAGYPLDSTYYQTVKAMVTPMDILVDGARLLVASDCSQGLGSADFRAAQARLVAQGPAAFLSAIADKALAEVDEWQTQMQVKPMRMARIGLYSTGLPAADRALTGVDEVADLGAALAESLAASGERAVAVIPEGPYVVPVYQAA